MRKWMFAAMLIVLSFLTFTIPAVAGTPVISGLSDFGSTEQDPAAVIDSDVSFTGGDSYSGGYLEFELAGETTEDTLGLVEDGSASTVDGQMSIVDGTVYLGSGSAASVIGSVNSTYNGQNGNALRINFSNEFENGNFDDGTSGSTTITGWTAVNAQVKFETDTIAGLPTPTDTDWPTNAGAGFNYTDQNTPEVLGTLNTVLSDIQNDGGGVSVRMSSTGMTTQLGFDIVRGPYIYSNSAVSLSVGDTVSFEWQAQGGNDAYDVYGYIVDEDTGHIETILNETGSSTSASTTWATETVTVSQGGKYIFVFVSGTYDYSGGQAAGAQLYIDDVEVTQAVAPATVTDAIISEIAQRVTFENTSDDPPTAGRTLTVEAQATDESTGSDTATITITAVNDDPTDISLSNTQIDVTGGINGVVGSLSSTDPDSSSFTYSLVSGAGDTDNGSFTISGSDLRANDAGMSSGSYSVRLQTDDGAGGIYAESFTLTVVDTDGDGVPDTQETADGTDPNDDADYTDTDGDGISDYDEGTDDTDGDSTPDHRDTDSDNDGIEDGDEGVIDTDEDGTPDYKDTDSDGDGIEDSVEGNVDTDSDGTPDFQDVEADGDGVGDEVENGAINDGDGNGDGTPDRLQARVTTLMDYDNTDYVTIETPEGTTLADVQAIDNPSPDDMPDGSTLTYGLYDFTINNVEPGGSVMLTLYLPEDARPDSYLKYGPTPDDETDHWYEFVYDGVTGAEIDGNVITLHFVDGDEGDDVLTPDGMIVDAGGPMLDSGEVLAGDYGPAGGCFVGSLAAGGNFGRLAAGALAALLVLMAVMRFRAVRQVIALTALIGALLTAFPGKGQADETDATQLPATDAPFYLNAGVGFAYIGESIGADYQGATCELTVDNDIYPVLRAGYAFNDHLALELGFRWDIYSGDMDRSGNGGSDNLKGYTFFFGPVYTFGEYSCKYLGPLSPMVHLNLGYTMLHDDLDYPVGEFDPALGVDLGVGVRRGNIDLRLGYRYFELDGGDLQDGVSAADDSLNLSGVYMEIAWRFSFGK